MKDRVGFRTHHSMEKKHSGMICWYHEPWGWKGNALANNIGVALCMWCLSVQGRALWSSSFCTVMQENSALCRKLLNVQLPGWEESCQHNGPGRTSGTAPFPPHALALSQSKEERAQAMSVKKWWEITVYRHMYEVSPKDSLMIQSPNMLNWRKQLPRESEACYIFYFGKFKPSNLIHYPFQPILHIWNQ